MGGLKFAEFFGGYFEVEVEVGGDVLKQALLNGIAHHDLEGICFGARDLLPIEGEFKALRIGFDLLEAEGVFGVVS